MLGLAKRVGARFLLTSTSEVYGDPLQHPQVETYWGNVNPIGTSCFTLFLLCLNPFLLYYLLLKYIFIFYSLHFIFFVFLFTPHITKIIQYVMDFFVFFSY